MDAVSSVRIGDLDVAFRRRGQGPPLVLLHGGICDSRVWRHQFDDLADGFTLVAWDAPGCGGSSDPPEWFRLPQYADVLQGLIDALDLGRPHVLGHSWGSGLALELFRRHPSTPASLVLAGGYAGWAGSLPPGEVDVRLQKALEVADQLPDGFDPRSVPGLFTDTMPADHRAELIEIMSQIRPTGTRGMARAFAEADLRDVLPDIDVPTLLLYGDADTRSPLDVARSLHASIPASTLVVMAGLGHEAFAEDPPVFDRHVRSFLSAS